MPDITMCQNEACTLKEVCYRYKATPSERQSYAVFSGGEWCKHFWPVHTMYTKQEQAK